MGDGDILIHGLLKGIKMNISSMIFGIGIGIVIGFGSYYYLTKKERHTLELLYETMNLILAKNKP